MIVYATCGDCGSEDHVDRSCEVNGCEGDCRCHESERAWFEMAEVEFPPHLDQGLAS